MKFLKEKYSVYGDGAVRGGALAQLCPEAVEILEKECPGRSPASWALRFAAGLPG